MNNALSTLIQQILSEPDVKEFAIPYEHWVAARQELAEEEALRGRVVLSSRTCSKPNFLVKGVPVTVKMED